MAARPTQRDRLLRILRDAGSAGVHTHELRHEGFGNPSQRVRELAELGHTIECKRERRNDSPGTRYTLKTAGGDGLAPSRDARPVRDHTPPSGEVAAPPALTNRSAVRGGEHDGAPKPSSSTAREQGAGADTVPAAGPISLFGDEAEPEVEGSTSPYRVFEDAA